MLFYTKESSAFTASKDNKTLSPIPIFFSTSYIEW